MLGGSTFAPTAAAILTFAVTIAVATDPAQLLAAKSLYLILATEILVATLGILLNERETFVGELGANVVERYETLAGLADPTIVF